MMKPLSTAKVRSVREIKKKAKMKKINKLITTIVVVVLLLLIVFFSTKTFFLEDFSFSELFSSDQEFRETEAGITFVSKNFAITDAITSLEKDQNISVFYSVPYDNPEYMSTIPDLFYIYPSVFSAKGKTTTLIIGILDEQNNLINCFSNLGDPQKNEELTYEECDELINKEQTLIYIRHPEDREKTEVYFSVEEKMITIVPKNIEDLHIATFLLLEAMYEDFENIMQKIREFSIDQDIDYIN